MRLLPGFVLLALLACGRSQPEKLGAHPSLARLVPPGAVALSGVRLESLRATALYQKLEASGRLKGADDFARQTGFDPRKDVSELLIATDGKESVALAWGRFQVKVPDSVPRTDYKRRAVYGTDEAAVAFLDASTAVAGSAAAVRAAIDRWDAKPAAPHPLLAKAAQMPPSVQLWAVASSTAGIAERYIPREGNLANVGKIFRSISSATLEADFRNGVAASITAECAADQDAKLLNDTLRGLLGLGRLSVPEKQPELLRLFDGVKVERRERSMHVTVSEPAELIDKLLEMLPAS